MPATMPERQSTEPTDRSMPPVMITAVMPRPMIPTKAKLRKTLKRLPGAKNAVVAKDR